MKTQCPHCKACFDAPDTYSGKKAKCPKCQQGVFVFPNSCKKSEPKQPDIPASKDDEKESNVTSIGLYAEGVNGQIELHGNMICICRKGMLGFLTQGLKGDKNIVISTITSIQLKKADMLTNGYIQFAFMGGQEAKGGLFQATQDENSIMFNQKQQPAFEKIRDEVERRIRTPISTMSDADELAKLATLRDKGILTEEEFQHKKKQLLGL